MPDNYQSNHGSPSLENQGQEKWKMQHRRGIDLNKIQPPNLAGTAEYDGLKSGKELVNSCQNTPVSEDDVEGREGCHVEVLEKNEGVNHHSSNEVVTGAKNLQPLVTTTAEANNLTQEKNDKLVASSSSLIVELNSTTKKNKEAIQQKKKDQQEIKATKKKDRAMKK
ncbi:hypothetical protein FXO38_31616 [Capsicum annuum]|nr:hypothetical protein FXO38_31616 [Capsicum annuum]KAF3683154.1 hypothetical protein FXO37_01999 [Capsicum annuum]